MRMAKYSQNEDIAHPMRSGVTPLRPLKDRASPLADGETPLSWFNIRQMFLDALPIAGTIIADLESGLSVQASNARFTELCDRSMNGDILSCEGISDKVKAFFAQNGEKAGVSFDWLHGDPVSGRHFHVSIASVAAVISAEDRCLLTLVDRTAEIESARSLRAEMLHDSLTGLPNRISFTEAVDDVAASATSVSHAVLLCDLSRFSRINESLGGIAGDEVIITVARRLVSALRAGDLLARVGGDEFGILMRLIDGPEDASEAARRIQSVLSTPFKLARFEVGLDCAIGCAIVGEGEQSSGEEVVRNAHVALKRAKSTGRIEIHRAGEVAISRYRLDLETELRRAITKGELTLAYQPIVDLATNRLTGFEALARWPHPDRGMIDPGEFIPVAEEAGLIVPLGRWAASTALVTLAEWDRRAGAPLPLSMSVNVSAIQLARDDVPGMIAHDLAATGLSGNRLTVELTESAIVQDPGRTSRALKALKALDTRIAMDDFGTGYSSLSYLRRLPIDILKIDRSFVSGMLHDRDKVAIVRAVLSLADALGMSTTAEGVETIELAQTLGALGCSRGQGYFYAAALSADAAFDYWRTRAG